MSKSRTSLSELAFENVATLLVEALERGTQAWPLPTPPIIDTDFPPIHPISPQDVIEQGLGLLHADRGMFEAKLNSVVDLIVPHRMNLTDDPFEVHQKWLEKRVDKVSERMVFLIATEWLSQALDPSAPNSDKWWISLCLIDGMATVARGQPVHQGYHLLESIALAERPGTWHTQPEAGPQNIDWNPHARVPRISSVVAHEEGVKAAIWLLKRLEEGNDDRRELLIEWIRLLLERPALIESLQLSDILMRRALDNSTEVAVKITLCLAKVIDYDREIGHKLSKRLLGREELEVRRSMADVLTRLFRRLGEDAIPFFEKMLQDEDEGVLAAVSSTVGDLRFLDTDLWADKMLELSNHELPLVRRNLVPGLRDYIGMFPEDERKILPLLWQDGDEVVRTRMRELLIRMEEVSSEHFAGRITDLKSNDCSLDNLWENLRLRRPERAEIWMNWLSNGGEIPPSLERKVHESTMEAPDGLPGIGEALEILDQELGFLD
jgi:hypothetical protein